MSATTRNADTSAICRPKKKRRTPEILVQLEAPLRALHENTNREYAALSANAAHLRNSLSCLKISGFLTELLYVGTYVLRSRSGFRSSSLTAHRCNGLQGFAFALSRSGRQTGQLDNPPMSKINLAFAVVPCVHSQNIAYYTIIPPKTPL